LPIAGDLFQRTGSQRTGFCGTSAQQGTFGSDCRAVLISTHRLQLMPTINPSDAGVQLTALCSTVAALGSSLPYDKVVVWHVAPARFSCGRASAIACSTGSAAYTSAVAQPMRASWGPRWFERGASVHRLRRRTSRLSRLAGWWLRRASAVVPTAVASLEVGGWGSRLTGKHVRRDAKSRKYMFRLRYSPQLETRWSATGTLPGHAASTYCVAWCEAPGTM